MLDCKTRGDWEAFMRVLSDNPVKRAVDKARRRIGIQGASMVQEGIVSGAPNGGEPFKALHAFTVRRKGSSKPLIDGGDLLGAVSYKLSGASDVFIGVKRGAKSKDGTDVADIAAVHEFGRIIAVTPKMRVYLASQGLPLRLSTTYIYIPARSFLRPVLESQEFRDKAAKITVNQLKKVLAPRVK